VKLNSFKKRVQVSNDTTSVIDTDTAVCGIAGIEYRVLGHRIDIGQKVHSRVKSVPECQPTSGVAAMLKATKPEEIL
jgi:hypothetical protein